MERPNDINKAYQEFSKLLKNYGNATADFMRDCVFIADFKGNNGVNDLPSQGFTRTLAASPFGDDLHLQYEKGDKGIDIYFLPDQNKVKITLLGFNPEDKNADTTKVFTTRDGADAVADFINNLPNYKGESKKKESKLKIKVHESSIEETIKQDILTAINDSDVVNKLNDLLSNSSHKILDAVLKKNGVLNKNPADWEQPFYDFTMDKLVELLKTDSNSFLQ